MKQLCLLFQVHWLQFEEFERAISDSWRKTAFGYDENKITRHSDDGWRDYLLKVAVRRFEADYTAGGAVPEVHVTLDCIIGRRAGRDVVATFVVSGAALATANRLSDVVSAFEQATGAALGALSQQAAQAARAATEHAAQNQDRPTPSISRQSQ